MTPFGRIYFRLVFHRHEYAFPLFFSRTCFTLSANSLFMRGSLSLHLYGVLLLTPNTEAACLTVALVFTIYKLTSTTRLRI